MNLKIILKESWQSFQENLTPLLKATAPYLAAALVLEVIANQSLVDLGSFLSYVAALASLLLKALITLAGLRYFYERENVSLKISINRVLVYIFASAYINVAVLLGLAFFVIPGIIIKAVTFLMPIFVLKDSQGPIEAVSSSATLVKDHIASITAFLFAIWALVTVVHYLLGLILSFLPLPTIISVCAAEFVSLFLVLFTLPVMISIYQHLTEGQLYVVAAE